MRSRFALPLALGLALSVGLPVAAQWTPSAEPLDLTAMHQIRTEGFEHSQVMTIESYLTDVYGPRLTNSPDMRQAADWAVKEMQGWGLANVHEEPWPFGRGWANDRFVALAVSPRAYPLIAYTKAWTPGTNGPVTAEAVYAPMESEADFARYRGTLKGKFVLISPIRDPEAHFEPQGRRFTRDDLQKLSMAPEPGQGPNEALRRMFLARRAFNEKLNHFLLDEGVAAVIESSRGDDGTVFVQSGGSQDPKAPPVPAQVVMAVEHYNRIARTLEKKIPVTLQFDIRNAFYDKDLNSFNIVAELPGTDKADQVVMLGAHFDSWHSGTGATDNAAGSAVMMEAMRILKESGVKLRRTVRLALWTGEEEGLLGSKAYVLQHFGDPKTMALKPEQAQVSAYFNVDNGTGAIRGVYLQGNEAVAPIFARWMEPFHDLGMRTLTIRNTGGTDHLSFDAVGIPGFQFIQDPIEYQTRTHHSNMDLYDRVQPGDMMKNAVIVASFVYDAATRDDLLPRKPLPPAPKPTTTQQGGR
ncbi:MAG: M20/M25/M40 family metallo-hydrolase [Acidobacteriota bacterium]|nr:M20/M25/M40 family metallo-hydrolase [Acidobacteriota bacterium]